MKEVEELDKRPNPKNIMTPAAAMLKEKVIQQNAIGENNHIFGAIRRELEEPKDPHTLSSLISSIASPVQEPAPLDKFIPTEPNGEPVAQFLSKPVITPIFKMSEPEIKPTITSGSFG